ncbi:MAG: hypothetical protein JNK12_18790 [Acidimicrobiales bacterium]|nr:hypothetical protein [Acidimicrobiales bacterium]
MFAYLDPGTGSIVLQVIVGGFAGLAVFFKMFGRRMMFWKKDNELTEGEGDTSADAEPTADAEPATVPPTEAAN